MKKKRMSKMKKIESKITKKIKSEDYAENKEENVENEEDQTIHRELVESCLKVHQQLGHYGTFYACTYSIFENIVFLVQFISLLNSTQVALKTSCNVFYRFPLRNISNITRLLSPLQSSPVQPVTISSLSSNISINAAPATSVVAHMS